MIKRNRVVSEDYQGQVSVGNVNFEFTAQTNPAKYEVTVNGQVENMNIQQIQEVRDFWNQTLHVCTMVSNGKTPRVRQDKNLPVGVQAN